MRALLGENDLANRLSLEKTLSLYGKVKSVSNEEDLINSFRSALVGGKPYNLVCIDAALLDKKDQGVIEKIRKIEKVSEVVLGGQLPFKTKIAIMGAPEKKEALMAVFQKQCDLFLVKPLQKEKFEEQLCQLKLIPFKKSEKRVLIAEDCESSRRILVEVLTKWGYSPLAVDNGKEAYQHLKQPEGPKIALIDWEMPEMDGTEVCRKIAKLEMTNPPYIIMLSSRDDKRDIVAGLEAGASDYLVKPFSAGVLRARLGVGIRILELQAALAMRIEELKEMNSHTKTLQGILPICPQCHSICTDEKSWASIKDYLAQHTDLQLATTICPQCRAKQSEQILR